MSDKKPVPLGTPLGGELVFNHERFRKPTAEEVKEDAKRRRPKGQSGVNPHTGQPYR